MDRIDFAFADQDLGVERILHRARLAVLDFGAEFFELVDRRIHRLGEIGMCGHVLFPVMAQYADAHALDIAPQRGAVIGDFSFDAARVFRVRKPAIACSRIAQSSTVRAIGPQWSNVNELGMTPARLTRPDVGISPESPQNDEGPRIEPPVSDPSGDGHDARRECRARAARRAAGEMFEVPRVARRGPRQFQRRPAVREFMRLPVRRAIPCRRRADGAWSSHLRTGRCPCRLWSLPTSGSLSCCRYP